MKKIRFKKDIECRLTVTVQGEVVSLEDSELTLVMIRPDKSRIRIPIEDIEENVLHFYITPVMQNRLGIYNLELWRDVGSGHQTICDVPNAFRLVPLSQQEGGESKENLETGTIGVTANFTGEYIVIDSLDSTLTDAALSANQGRILDNKITSVSENVSAEATAREKGDEELQEAIDKEAESRTEADAKLAESVQDEATARKNADTELEKAIEDEETARKNADTKLEEDIESEAQARTAADTKLEEAIGSEAETREEQIAALAKAIVTLKESLEKLTGDTVTWQTNDDYIIAFVDSEDNLLMGLTKDAKLYLPVGLPDAIVGLRELLDQEIPVIEWMTDDEVRAMFEDD